MARWPAMPPRLAEVADSPAFAGTAWPSVLLDRRGVVRAVNDAYLGLVEGTPDDLLGHDLVRALSGPVGQGPVGQGPVGQDPAAGPDTAHGAIAGGAADDGMGALQASVAQVVASGRPHVVPTLRLTLRAAEPGGSARARVWAVEHLPVADGDTGVIGVWQHVEDVTRAATLLGAAGRPGAPPAVQQADLGALVRHAERADGERHALLADNRRLAAALAAMVGAGQQLPSPRGQAHRRRQLWTMVVRRTCSPRRLAWADAVAQVAVDALPVVAGCAVTVGTGAFRHLLAASDAWAAHLHAVEDTAGEGPGLQAVAAGVPAGASSLADVSARWPGFRQAVGDTELTGAAGFPLVAATGPVGALVVYQRGGRVLSASAQRDALLLADLAATVVLHDLDGFDRVLEIEDVPGGTGAGAGQRVPGVCDAAGGPLPDGDPAGVGTGPGAAAEVGPGDDGLRAAGTATQIRRAVGLVAVELGLTVEQALSVLRARAFAEGRLLGTLADDVVARRVRLAEDSGDRPR